LRALLARSGMYIALTQRRWRRRGACAARRTGAGTLSRAWRAEWRWTTSMTPRAPPTSTPSSATAALRAAKTWCIPSTRSVRSRCVLAPPRRIMLTAAPCRMRSLPPGLRHVCHGRVRWVRQHLGRRSQEAPGCAAQVSFLRRRALLQPRRLAAGAPCSAADAAWRHASERCLTRRKRKRNPRRRLRPAIRSRRASETIRWIRSSCAPSRRRR
jgi:hypothetical protein